MKHNPLRLFPFKFEGMNASEANGFISMGVGARGAVVVPAYSLVITIIVVAATVAVTATAILIISVAVISFATVSVAVISLAAVSFAAVSLATVSFAGGRTAEGTFLCTLAAAAGIATAL